MSVPEWLGVWMSVPEWLGVWMSVLEWLSLSASWVSTPKHFSMTACLEALVLGYFRSYVSLSLVVLISECMSLSASWTDCLRLTVSDWLCLGLTVSRTLSNWLYRTDCLTDSLSEWLSQTDCLELCRTDCLGARGVGGSGLMKSATLARHVGPVVPNAWLIFTN